MIENQPKSSAQIFYPVFLNFVMSEPWSHRLSLPLSTVCPRLPFVPRQGTPSLHRDVLCATSLVPTNEMPVVVFVTVRRRNPPGMVLPKD